MAIKTFVAVAFFIAAVPPTLLHSASNADYYNESDLQKKTLLDGAIANGYWFSYTPGSSCSKCNCSVTVTNVFSNFGSGSATTFVLNVNKSDCKLETSLDRDCTCYGYPDYFIGIIYESGFINGSMGDSWCIGATQIHTAQSQTFLNCHGVHRSETIVYY